MQIYEIIYVRAISHVIKIADFIVENNDLWRFFLEKIAVKSLKTAIIQVIFTMIQMVTVFEFMTMPRRLYHRLSLSCSFVSLMNEKGDDFLLPISRTHTKKSFS